MVGLSTCDEGHGLASPGPGLPDLLEPVDGGHVGVVEGGEELGLALGAGQPLRVPRDLGREHLDRHVTIELRVGGPADFSQRRFGVENTAVSR
jgi:hypothetical protein